MAQQQLTASSEFANDNQQALVSVFQAVINRQEGDPAASTLTARLHYNSSELGFVDPAQDILGGGLFLESPETVDDGNDQTDRQIQFSYPFSTGLNSDNPTELALVTFNLLEGFDGESLPLEGSNSSFDVVPFLLNIPGIGGNNMAPVITLPAGPFQYTPGKMAGFLVGDVDATDADGTVASFAIVTDTEFFAINDQGMITLTEAGAAEMAASNNLGVNPNTFELQITATDNQGLASAATTVTINLVEVDNIAPEITLPAGPFEYTPGKMAGFLVGDVDATDADGTVASFAIVGGSQFFAIDNQGMITLTEAGAAEMAASNNLGVNPNTFALEITATDNEGLASAPTTVTINLVEQIADNTPPVVTEEQSYNYVQGQAAGDVVATVEATDDVGVTGFAINPASDVNGFFAINDAGEISLTADGAAAMAASNNFENPPNSFTLSITASDAAGNTSAPTNVILNVLAEDRRAPVVTPNQTLEYAENQVAGDVVATVEATDNVGVTGFAIDPASNADGFFVINDQGQISLTADGAAAMAASNDFETLPNQFTLSITATDGAGNNSAQTPVTLRVTDVVDETAPVIPPGQTFGYTQDRVAGAVVGAVLATDNVGVTGYGITSGNENGFFAINNAGQISLTEAGVAAMAASNDFAIEPNQFILGITASDEAGNTSAETPVTLNVTETDINAPVITPAQTFSYQENQIAGFEVGTVQATDDLGVVTAYTIANGNAAGFFAINPENGIITLTAAGAAAMAASNDFETLPNMFTLGITASDGAGNISDVTDLTVNVTDDPIDNQPPQPPIVRDPDVPIDDTLTGTAANDSIQGSSGNDSITGLAGDDTLRGARGRDFIQGEEGNDTVRGGNAKDTLTGGMGNDLIVGGKGDDSISGDEGNDSIQGAENRDIITGGEGNDTIRGGNAIDNLDGGLGDDSIIGGKGNDTLLGGSGNDTLDGSAGKDSLVGGLGTDVLQGGNGQDTLIGGQQTFNDFERDTLTGGNGLDTFVLQTTDANANADVITDFVAGTDKFGLTGGLTFTDLTVAGVGANVTITNNNTGFLLAIVENAALANVNNAANFETFVF
ncbi:hypothetical protein [Crocosphaera sp. XPORK-15E]|uniref:hypothetical protein n=1 Tax=Crocosphaera sp. XPORK-15E TaxID=3110247 RepID=UPI002B20A61F|nr:hypothetical protein [Crocosphaera sp. XPORK-15E]MEA5535205.1 hypothetical protein [Crocosphaera sp. XPORK-15E]